MVLWEAFFNDGHSIQQPADDRYSKHDDSSGYNPSAFRDIQDYEKKAALTIFILGDVQVSLSEGFFIINGVPVFLEDEPLTDRKLIYYRVMETSWTDGLQTEPKILKYAVGYEGKNSKGKVEKKVIYIDGE